MKSVEERLRAANPVPDPTTAMDQATYVAVFERVKPRDASPRSGDVRWEGRQTWQLASACVFLALALGVGFLWGRTQQTTLVAAEQPSLRVARAYIEARNDSDAEAALDLLASESTVVEYPVVRDAAELPAAFQYLELVDEQFTNTACDSVLGEPGVVVCLYEMRNRLVERAGLESISGNLRFTVDQDRIVRVENTIDYSTYESTVLTPWFDWLETEYEGGLAAQSRWIFQLNSIVSTPRLDALDRLGDALDRYSGTG